MRPPAAAALDTALAAGTVLPKPEGVFPRHVEPESTEQAAS
ncbi:MAG: hypothetical protein V3U23_07155 [Kiloniellales bacterium]